MNSLRHLFALAVASLWFAVPSAFAAFESRTFTVGSPTGIIPDNQDPPTTFLQTINDSLITSLTKVEVGLHLVGTTPGSGFASDMFVSLNKDLTTTSILLNRVGVTSSDPVGYFYDGWDVTFSDGADNVHQATLSSSVLTGTWGPDGRIHPTDTDPTFFLLLSQFIGGTGNGDWRLSAGDLGLDGTMRLESWRLDFTGDVAPVPEPGTWLAGACALFILVRTWRKCPKRAA